MDWLVLLQMFHYISHFFMFTVSTFEHILLKGGNQKEKNEKHVVLCKVRKRNIERVHPITKTSRTFHKITALH